MLGARFVIYIYGDVSRFFSLLIDLEASYRLSAVLSRDNRSLLEAG